MVGKEDWWGNTMRRLISLAILLGGGRFCAWACRRRRQGVPRHFRHRRRINKQVAVESSRSAIQTEIEKLQTENHITTVESKAWKPDPRPYWRSSVSDYLFLPPDEVTDQVYTICWKGVVSPAVCTSGTEVCWPTN